MSPKRASGLVRLSVILLKFFLVGTHTPAIATDLIYDIMKIATGILQFLYRIDVALDGFANKKC